MSVTLMHSPLPWAVGIAQDPDDALDYSDVRIVQGNNDDMRVAFLANDGTLANPTGRANATLIVRAVNCHQELIDALQSAMKVVRYYAGVDTAASNTLEVCEAVLRKAEGR